MATWPSIQSPSYPLSEEQYLPQVRSEMEDGPVVSRPRATSSRNKWALSWRALPDADYQTLKTFFTNNQGGVFTWTHPITSTSYTARFSSDQISASKVTSSGTWQVSVEIEQV